MDPTIPQPITSTPTSTVSVSVSEEYGACGGAGAIQKDPTNIVKGKRTKRQRPTIVTHSSSSYNAVNSSPASYSSFPASSTTAEDEDTANCLILLSKGHNVNSVSLSPRNNNNINIMHEFSGYKFNSKRYIQTSTDAVNGPTGMYVYECKTCSRTFASFQALGGHRASHKKPRINELETRKPPKHAVSEEDDTSPRFESQFESRKNVFSSSSSLSLQINHRMVSGNTKKPSSKFHDCSICGAEFNSGQALGGHMRRHRAVNGNVTAVNAGVTVTATNTTLSLVPYVPVTSVVGDDHDNQKSMNDGLCLDLDLNLPAPPESTSVAVSDQDQRRESSFKFTANQNKQQPTVHLSAAPTLVDCQY